VKLRWIGASLCTMAIAGGAGCRDARTTNSLDSAAEKYVRIVLALAERDSDSLDSYHGPSAWQEDARARHAPLADVRRDAVALAESMARDGSDARRAFLVRQLRAVAARIDILAGARPTFGDEAASLFGFSREQLQSGAEAGADEAAIRARIDALLPGRDALNRRYAAFDRQFVIRPDRLETVLARAVDGCRTATAAHMDLPRGERIDVEYVPDFAWAAFTRYEGGFHSRVRVNAAAGLTVDRALDLACHETYPGHHTINAALDREFGGSRPELLVQPLFSPQTLLHEAAASIAPDLAFPGDARVAFERDVLFPLARLNPSDAAKHVEISRLVDRLHTAEARIAQQYLDGALDFPRAAAALEREALAVSPDQTLKFLNRFRSSAAAYTIGRDLLAGQVGADWHRYLEAVRNPAQQLPQSGSK